MIHYLYAVSPTLSREISQFEFYGMLGGEHTQDTSPADAQTYANEFAAMLNADAYLTATDWAGVIKTVKPE